MSIFLYGHTGQITLLQYDTLGVQQVAAYGVNMMLCEGLQTVLENCHKQINVGDRRNPNVGVAAYDLAVQFALPFSLSLLRWLVS
jgi:hypothetical protein